MPKILRTILIGIAAFYAAICLVMWAFQERLFFPAWLASASAPLSSGAERIILEAEDGVALEGVYLRPAEWDGDGTLLLAFGGNATNAQVLAERLQRAFPNRPVAAFHYRGYAPSGGSPSATSMADDAPLAYDFVMARYRPRRVVGIGVSLGSGIAATLASRRPLGGLILVTPFDSLKATAQQLYWWLPVSMLPCHDVDSVAALSGRPIPVAIIAAGGDNLVRPERTDALRVALVSPRADMVLPGVEHSEIFSHPGLDDALRGALDSLGR